MVESSDLNRTFIVPHLRLMEHYRIWGEEKDHRSRKIGRRTGTSVHGTTHIVMTTAAVAACNGPAQDRTPQLSIMGWRAAHQATDVLWEGHSH